MTYEQDVNKRLEELLSRAKAGIKESEKDAFEKEMDKISNELEKIRKEKEGIADCFILDMTDRAATIWFRDVVSTGAAIVSDEKGTRYVMKNLESIPLQDFGLDQFLAKMDESQTKVFLKVLLNESSHYFTKLDLSELKALSLKLLDDAQNI